MRPDKFNKRVIEIFNRIIYDFFQVFKKTVNIYYSYNCSITSFIDFTESLNFLRKIIVLIIQSANKLLIFTGIVCWM